VPDGIVFPILVALSVFGQKTSEGWQIKTPKQFNDAELIRAAVTALQRLGGIES
jgi:hypothetical protein